MFIRSPSSENSIYERGRSVGLSRKDLYVWASSEMIYNCGLQPQIYYETVQSIDRPKSQIDGHLASIYFALVADKLSLYNFLSALQFIHTTGHIRSGNIALCPECGYTFAYSRKKIYQDNLFTNEVIRQKLVQNHRRGNPLCNTLENEFIQYDGLNIHSTTLFQRQLHLIYDLIPNEIGNIDEYIINNFDYIMNKCRAPCLGPGANKSHYNLLGMVITQIYKILLESHFTRSLDFAIELSKKFITGISGSLEVEKILIDVTFVEMIRRIENVIANT